MKRLYDITDLNPGELTITQIHLEAWGSRIRIVCLYRHPSQEKRFELHYEDCRGIHWNVQKAGHQIKTSSVAHLLTHDLGQADYERPARFASTLVELIVSYRTMKIVWIEADSIDEED